MHYFWSCRSVDYTWRCCVFACTNWCHFIFSTFAYLFLHLFGTTITSIIIASCVVIAIIAITVRLKRKVNNICYAWHHSTWINSLMVNGWVLHITIYSIYSWRELGIELPQKPWLYTWRDVFCTFLFISSILWNILTFVLLTSHPAFGLRQVQSLQYKKYQY